jgi:hypothetical protein
MWHGGPVSAGTAVAVSMCVLLVAGAVALLVVLNRRQQRRRREALWAWAAGHGWQVGFQPQHEWYRRLPGSGRRGVSVALYGQVRGWRVAVGEYSYTETTTVGEQTSSQTHRFVVTVVWLARPYPSIAVQRRGAMSKLGRALFGPGQVVTGNPDFDRAFRIDTKDAALARHLIGPPLVHAHLAGAVPPWSLVGDELLMYQPGRLTDLDAIPALAGQLTVVADLLGRS